MTRSGPTTPGPKWAGFDDPSPDSDADRAPESDPESVARAILLRQLTAGPRTRMQLADALKRKNVPDEVADALLDRFTDVGLIDDVEFARMWAGSRHRGRGLGRRALAYELRSKGVDDASIGAALAEISEDDERQRAHDLVARKMTSVSRLEPLKARQRLVGMLARRGYSLGLAESVVRDALAQHAAEDDEAV